MMTFTTHFQVLLKNIRPADERTQAAETLPPLVRSYLEEHMEFETLAPHSRLVGSYAQNMSVGDVKDVDFLVRVDGDPENNEPEAKQVVQDLKKALDGLPAALEKDGYADIDVERARRSVHVYIEDEDFHIDAVPCIAPDGFDEPIWVPDRGWNKWVPSHPVGYIKLLNDLNREHGRKVKPLGKLLKHFRNYQMKTRRPKSYWLGALLVHHVQENLDTSQPLAVLFRDLMKAIYNEFAPILGRTDGAVPHIKDPVLGHDISWNWERSHFETFMRRVKEAWNWADRALCLDPDKRDEAIELWQKIFGEEYFPSEVEEAAMEQAKASYPGASVVSRSGLVVPAAAALGSFTATRPTRFYGS